MSTDEPSIWANDSPRDVVLITVAEAARRLNVPAPRIRRWIEAGYLTAYRVDGKRNRYVALDDVERVGPALASERRVPRL